MKSQIFLSIRGGGKVVYNKSISSGAEYIVGEDTIFLYDIGQEIVFKARPKHGYVFEGWIVDGSLVGMGDLRLLISKPSYYIIAIFGEKGVWKFY